MRARKMRIVDGTASCRISVRIQAEKDLNRLAPIGPVAFSIQQAHIEFHMLAIIGRERITGRWFIEIVLCRASHHSLTIG